MGSFVQRKLDVVFTLASGTFNGNEYDQVVIKDMRVRCVVDYPGSESMGSATIQIYGMSKALMDRLTVYPMSANAITKSHVTIKAGTTENDMSVIFDGQIFKAYADYSSAPDVSFNVDAIVALVANLKPVDALSFEGSVKVETIAEKIAEQLGAKLINESVDGFLTDASFRGTATEKLWKLRKSANIDVYYQYQSDYPVLRICKKGYPINSQYVPIIAPETGLVGWPMPDGAGFCYIDVLFNPSIAHGGEIDVKSDYPNADGTWYVLSMVHKLESQLPGGAWMTKITAGRLQNSVRS